MVFQVAHNNPMAGHLGQDKTYNYPILLAGQYGVTSAGGVQSTRSARK
uniref:Uncharacterized protein n=1 Tax=Anguilla anguilla TaxID=7936 RepID=A0A0E9W7J6_ANGAN